MHSIGKAVCLGRLVDCWVQGLDFGCRFGPSYGMLLQSGLEVAECKGVAYKRGEVMLEWGMISHDE